MNEIGDEGMKYLSESLKSNNSIQTLNLECNKIKNKNTNKKTINQNCMENWIQDLYFGKIYK